METLPRFLSDFSMDTKDTRNGIASLSFWMNVINRLMFSVHTLLRQPVFVSERFQIRGVGFHEVMPPCYVTRPRGTGDCLFMLFHDSVKIGPPRQERPCEAGSIVLWPHGAAHFYGNTETRWSHSWVHCQGERVLEVLDSLFVPLDTPIALYNPTRVGRYLLDLHEELTSNRPLDRHIAENTLENLLREVARSQDTPRPAPVAPALILARQSLETRYDEPLNLTCLAAEAHLSCAHFCTAFRRAFGVAPMAYLQQRRMDAATLLLLETTLDIGEIGRRVGYDNPYHFSKTFKRGCGMSPSQFRSQRRA